MSYCLLMLGGLVAGLFGPSPKEYLSPVALVASRDGQTLYVAEATGNQIAAVDVASGKIKGTVEIPSSPSDIVLSADGNTLYVSGAAPEGRVFIIDAKRLQLTDRIRAGHTASAVAVSPDGARLYVCNRFNNNVSIVDLRQKKEITKVAVQREPIACVLSPDGKYLFVANLVPAGPATGDSVNAAVSVIDTAAGQVTATLQLPNGSSSLRGICMSPDGKFVYVTHILAHYQLPTTQLERGWMNTNALTIIDAEGKKVVNTVLLDDIDLGAANPWGIACTADGKYICIAHAGTDEISVIDRGALHEKLAKVAAGQKVANAPASAVEVPSDLSFLVGLRRRLPLAGRAPRGLAVIGTKVYAAEYYSDSLGVVDIQPDVRPDARSLPLGPQGALSVVRRGEIVFHSGASCFQKWQSCSSCHPDVRVDGFNWDLLNDGIGNPKNTKSMYLVMRTPPSMSLGVRESAHAAVRAGFKYILFGVPKEEDCVAVEAFLDSLQPVPSPYLVNGRLSNSARRGKTVFKRAGCAECHPAPLYTNMRSYDVGLGVGPDKDKAFDTPTLAEIWRTAPYLHDGRAATLKEVFTKCNRDDQHGTTSKLSDQELNDLVEFVLSL